MQFVPRNNLKYEEEMSSTMFENPFGLKFSALCICGICQLSVHPWREGRYQYTCMSTTLNNVKLLQ